MTSTSLDETWWRARSYFVSQVSNAARILHPYGLPYKVYVVEHCCWECAKILLL